MLKENKNYNFDAIMVNDKPLIIEGVRVLHCNQIFKDSNIRGAMYTKIQLTTDLFPIDTVIVDDWFLRQDHDSQMFFILHEIGHIKLNHLEKMKEVFSSNNKYLIAACFGTKKYIDFESEADRFAAALIGPEAAIKGLKAVALTVNPIDRFLTTNRIIRKRINNVKDVKKRF